MKFKITPDAKKAVIKHLSNNGLLDLHIERNGPNGLSLSGQYEGLKVVELGDISVYQGDSLTISGIKMILDFDD